jgi:hypothetical protein
MEWINEDRSLIFLQVFESKIESKISDDSPRVLKEGLIPFTSKLPTNFAKSRLD